MYKPRLKLCKYGYRYLTLCPFHEEKTPSFIICFRKETYNCLGCGAHGILKYLKYHMMEKNKKWPTINQQGMQ
jgi:DNA primase